MIIIVTVTCVIIHIRKVRYNLQVNTAYGNNMPLYEQVAQNSQHMPHNTVEIAEGLNIDHKYATVAPIVVQRDNIQGVTVKHGPCNQATVENKPYSQDIKNYPALVSSCTQHQEPPNDDIDEALGDEFEQVKVFELPHSLTFIPRHSEYTSVVDEGAQLVSIAQKLSQANGSVVGDDSDKMPAYGRVQYGEKTLQLIRGVMRPYEQISGYERVHYSETMELIWRTIFGKESVEPYEQISGYERVQYDEEAMRLLRRMPHTICTVDEQYERVHYSESVKDMLMRNSREDTTDSYTPYEQISGYERVRYDEEAIEGCLAEYAQKVKE